MTKSQQYFQDMIERNKELFAKFQEVHDKFDPKTKVNLEAFNEVGFEVREVIRKFENLLCGYSESGKYGKFSNKTAETFWNYIRRDFPKIDFIGMR